MSIRRSVGTQAQIVALAVYQLKNGGYEEFHFGAIAFGFESNPSQYPSPLLKQGEYG